MSFSILIFDMKQAGRSVPARELTELGKTLKTGLVNRGIAYDEEIEHMAINDILWIEVEGTTSSQDDSAINYILYSLEEWKYEFEFDIDADRPDETLLVKVYSSLWDDATNITKDKIAHLCALFIEHAGGEEALGDRFFVQEKSPLEFEVICRDEADLETVTNFFRLAAGKLAIAKCHVEGYLPPEEPAEPFWG